MDFIAILITVLVLLVIALPIAIIVLYWRMHGKTDRIFHRDGVLFGGIESPFVATRYHSLVIEPSSLPDAFEVTAWSELPGDDREIMAISHRDYPLFGLQFHPESFLTADGTQMLRHFLAVS